MKLFTIYLITSLVGFQSLTMSISSFINFPELVEHYQLHKNEYGNSISEFLDLHYGVKKMDHDGKHKAHENLPFQQIQYSSLTFYFEYIEDYKIDFVKSFDKICHNFEYNKNFKFLEVTDILQPPK